MKSTNKKQIAIDKLNEKIDNLIINGKDKTAQFKKLMRLHKQLISS